MRKTFLTAKGLLLSAALLTVGTLTSCVYDKDVEEPAQGGDGTLVININSTPVGATMRATTITDGNSSVNSTAEKTVSTLALAIYSSEGMDKRDFQYLKDLKGTTDNWTTVTEHKDLTDAIAAGDLVLAAVNVPQSVADDLQEAVTAEDFRKVLTTIDQALIFADSYTADQTIDPAKLPMYGSGNVTADDVTGNFKVTVNVMHMVSKVTLSALTVSGSDNYQFKLEQAFLINVPEKLDFAFTTDGVAKNYGFGALTVNFFQGESEDVETKGDAQSLTTRGFRNYLGTTALDKTVTTATALDATYTFYTMPNSAVTDTRLVLKGQWTEDAGTNWTPVWYTVQLRNVETGVDVGSDAALSIYPNRHYVVSLDIQRKGQLNVEEDGTGAYNGLDSQSAARATIDVTDWSDGTKATEFGGNGGTPTQS